MKKLLPILLIGIVLISGCTGSTGDVIAEDIKKEVIEQPEEEVIKEEPILPTKVTPINLLAVTSKNWDADAENDGIEVFMIARDENDKTITTDGTVNAKLYSSILSMGGSIAYKEKLLQEWSNIEVSKNDMSPSGFKVKLEFSDNLEELIDSGKNAGWLDITFTTPDEKEFDAKEETVLLDI